ncbi:MAG: hypothetical protein ACM3TN_17430 [Alphaproteobacteria bacterium]
MKTMSKFLVITFITFGFSGFSFAQAKPATPAAPTMEKKSETKAKPSRIWGQVTSVDAKAGTIALKTKDKNVSINAESKSVKAELEKFKVGDRVRVSYNEKDGKMVATSVKAAKSKAATTEKKPETK